MYFIKKCCNWIYFFLQNITFASWYTYFYIHSMCIFANIFLDRKCRAVWKEQIEWEYKERVNNLNHNEFRGKCLWCFWNPVKWEKSCSFCKGSTVPILKNNISLPLEEKFLGMPLCLCITSKHTSLFLWLYLSLCFFHCTLPKHGVVHWCKIEWILL